MLCISSLNSGSNGNCYYAGNHEEAILIDAGISCREIEKRMLRLNMSMEKIKAVFISHEHTDHIRGLERLAARYNLPVYITERTLHNCRLYIKRENLRTFSDGSEVRIGNITVYPFSKEHDAADPFSFMVEHNGVRAGIMTDIGTVCNSVIRYFRQCHAVFLESNYDEEMLEQGNYPFHLKRRIRGGKGHLSNREAFDLFVKYRSPHLSHLLLSHLSEHNNCPDIVYNLFKSHDATTEIAVASRYKESPVFTINPSVREAVKTVMRTEQMSLF